MVRPSQRCGEEDRSEPSCGNVAGPTDASLVMRGCPFK